MIMIVHAHFVAWFKSVVRSNGRNLKLKKYIYRRSDLLDLLSERRKIKKLFFINFVLLFLLILAIIFIFVKIASFGVWFIF